MLRYLGNPGTWTMVLVVACCTQQARAQSGLHGEGHQPSQADNDYRIWQRKDGRLSTRADFLRLVGDVAYFRQPSGDAVTSTLDALCPEDRAIVIRLAESSQLDGAGERLVAMVLQIQDFPQAIRELEAIIQKPPANISQADIQRMDEILNFVSGQLPQPMRSAPQDSESQGTRYEWRKVYYRDRSGRLCWRCECVRIEEPREKSYGQSPASVLRLKIDDLSDSIANLANSQGVDLNDLARQIYGVTLTADNISPPGQIIRQ